MKERFEGDEGKSRLIQALKGQKMVLGDLALARELAELIEVVEVAAGTSIIEQDGTDTDFYFILMGAFNVLVNGRSVGQRFPDEHVGEMVTLDPTAIRSATIQAAEQSVVGKLTQDQLSEVLERYPDARENLTKELARRLEQRNSLVNPVRSKIRVFVISSTEALPIAQAVQSELAHEDYPVTTWSNGVFTASDFPLESLEKEIEDSDFAVAIAQADDLATIRGENKPVPRDNVIFEIGLCIGRLGRRRTLILIPRDKKVKTPSDLRGMTVIGYQTGESEDIRAHLGPACTDIRNRIKELGPKN